VQTHVSLCEFKKSALQRALQPIHHRDRADLDRDGDSLVRPTSTEDGMTGVPTAHGDQQRLGLIMFMREFEKQEGYLPTIADMAKGLNLHRTAVVWHLEMLRDEGRIDYVDGHMARSLKLLSR
jgi:hypothetical protein